MKENEAVANPIQLTLTDKEELAVLVERLNRLKSKTKNIRSQVQLDLATDLVRNAIYGFDKV
jgi:hypothetical protein